MDWLGRHANMETRFKDEPDEVVRLYIEELWLNGDQKVLAGDALSGLQHFNGLLRGKLKGSFKLLGVWGKLEMPCRAPAMLPIIAEAVAGLSLRDNNLQFAAMILFGFHGMLRPCELLSLRTKDLLVNESSDSLVIDLGISKSGQRLGVREYAIIEDAKTVAFAQLLVSKLPPEQILWNSSQAEFRKVFASYIAELGLASVGYTPYSARRGGATEHFKTHHNITFTAERGRWLSTRTAKIYITEALAELSAQKMTKVQRNRQAQWSAFYRQQFA